MDISVSYRSHFLFLWLCFLYSTSLPQYYNIPVHYIFKFSRPVTRLACLSPYRSCTFVCSWPLAVETAHTHPSSYGSTIISLFECFTNPYTKELTSVIQLNSSALCRHLLIHNSVACLKDVYTACSKEISPQSAICCIAFKFPVSCQSF